MSEAIMRQRIYVVDDDAAVRDSLSLLLDSVGLDATAFASAQEFLSAYEGQPGVVILDVRMPGMGGIELQETLNERGHDELAVIFISGHGDIPMAVEAIKRGAADFLPKPFRDQELIDRVQHTLSVNEVGIERAERMAEVNERIARLTPRERQVMEMVADGKANKVIAFDLEISQRTVELHRAQVMDKMGVRNLAHLVRSLHTAGYFD